jgi:hypothetical protein
MVLDIGWGFDLGEDIAHITTNVSPGPGSEDESEHSWGVHFFHADQIVKIEDAETGAVLLDLGGT